MTRRRTSEVAFRVRPIPPAVSEEWIYGRDRIRHRTGRFFSVAGLEFRPPDARRGEPPRRQPIVDQPEVGTLGFVTCRTRSGVRVLVQRKFEPGNVRGAQLAPTCQATLSNLERVHGGEAPPGASFFAEAREGVRIVSDSLQSEQGTRFFGKRNRNVTIDLATDDGDPGPAPPRLRWMEGRRLLALLASNHRVNTDARSVLVCAPWATWTGGRPFQPASRRWLRDAYEAPSDAEVAEGVAGHLAWLAGERRRLAREVPRLVALDELDGYRLDGFGLSGPPQDVWDVRHFAVRIPSRERPAWDQPLAVSRGPGSSVLCAFRRGRDLRFLFRAAFEPGLHDGVELHPTLCDEPGRVPPESAGSPFAFAARAPALAEVWQSEEGGRFFRERVRHRIVLIADPGMRLPEGYRSVGLREAEALAGRAALTNEARSTLSLILSLA